MAHIVFLLLFLITLDADKFRFHLRRELDPSISFFTRRHICMRDKNYSTLVENMFLACLAIVFLSSERKTSDAWIQLHCRPTFPLSVFLRWKVEVCTDKNDHFMKRLIIWLKSFAFGTFFQELVFCQQWKKTILNPWKL